MYSPPTSLSLTRRLLGHYLMFVLAGLFACIVAVMYLAIRGDLLELSVAVLVIPLIVVVVGAYVLYRLVRVNSHIEEQLHRVGTGSMPLGRALSPLPETAPLTVAWNALVRQIHDQLNHDALSSQLNSFVATLNQRWWEIIVNSLPDGIVACDRGGKVTHANRSALMLLGVEPTSAPLGQSIIGLLEARLPSSSHAPLDNLREGTGTAFAEVRHGQQLADGVWRVTRTPVLGEAPYVDGTLWILRDITQQRMAEDTRDQFVTMVTHELRTPLASIKAYAETLAIQENIDPERQKGFYNTINAEATRLARFIDDLLNVSQMETGGLALARSDIEIERFVTDVADHVAPQLAQKSLKFDTQFPPKYPHFRADKDKLSAALVNLLGNAIKYTPDGGWVQLKIDVDESRIHFSVADSGIGIAPEELPKMGTKFYRSSDLRVQGITGSGLGLAFTQEVARLHEGTLTVTSELNKGSVFTLSLPLVQ